MPPRTLIRDLLLLTALCWIIYLPGLTTQGLSNWQESQRALVAREMQSRGEWIVPTVEGRPYLAKPPMMYWCQMAIAGARGAASGEFELRLTVALAGWLGVLATYLVGFRMLSTRGRAFGGVLGVDPAAGARWASVYLATGLLYVHSSRVGELDILLVPFCVVAIGAVFEAWRAANEHERTALGFVSLAAASGVGAALAKGPPALLPIGLASYGGMALYFANEALPDSPPPARRAGAAIGAVALFSAVLAFSWPHGLREWIGALLLGIFGGVTGGALAGLANPRRARHCIRAFSRTHPIAVLGLPLLAFAAWMWLASRRLGADVVQATFEAERQDNLRILVPESPVFNIEAALYGAGIGSLCAAAAIVWMWRRRIRPGPSLCVLLAWSIGGVIAFSVLGKGVPRYLTPIWPGLALLGSVWFAGLVPRLRRGVWLARFAVLCVAAAAALQTWWYGWGRESWYPEASPRALVRELLAIPGVSADRLGSFEFDFPAVDFYAGRAVPSYLDIVPRQGLVGVGPRTTADLREDLRKSGATGVLLIRATQPQGQGQDATPATERIAAAGLEIEPIPLHSHFRIDNGRTEVLAVRVRPRE
jgi:4-amino-4-deoxy-L-arabinose transferase-like glycosyltransferase